MNIQKSNDKKLIKSYYKNLLLSLGYDKKDIKKKRLIKKGLKNVTENILNFHTDQTPTKEVMDKLFLEKISKTEDVKV